MMRSLLIISFILGIVILYNSCYFDKKEQLFPVITPCDTTNFTYSGAVKGILDNYCNSNGCHSTSSALGGVILDTYTGAKTVATNGQLITSLKGPNNGMPNMPLG